MNRRLFLGAALSVLATPAIARTAKPVPRMLRMRHLNTEERIDLGYRAGEHYQRAALAKFNHFLRDFRTGESTAIDPRLLDLLYDIALRLGEPRAEFEIIGGYRSPRTNSMLRKTSSGVAKDSLHTTGQAVDFRMANISTRQVRDAAVALARGGVGYYPRSNFVHVDTGQVRRWGA